MFVSNANVNSWVLGRGWLGKSTSKTKRMIASQNAGNKHATTLCATLPPRRRDKYDARAPAPTKDRNQGQYTQKYTEPKSNVIEGPSQNFGKSHRATSEIASAERPGAQSTLIRFRMPVLALPCSRESAQSTSLQVPGEAVAGGFSMTGPTQYRVPEPDNLP